MKVIFLEHVLHVAKAGEVKDVSSGYASNYLFPKWLAKPYTDAMAQAEEKQTQKREHNRRMLLGNKQEILDTLSGQTLEFPLKTTGKKVFGSVSPKDVADQISKKYHIPLTKKHIDFWGTHSNFKELWEYDIYIDLGNNFATKMHISLIPESWLSSQ